MTYDILATGSGGSEIWKDIQGYEGLYQISNMGRVKSLERTRNMNLPGHKKPAPVRERILKFGQSQGYQAVTLAKCGVNRKIRVHKLVALAFVPNPDRKPEINHKDGNKHNNIAENLEWVTPKENIRHAINTGLITSFPSNKGRRHTEETLRRMSQSHRWGTSKNHRIVDQYSKSGEYIRTWNGFAAIEKELGLCKQNIQKCCCGATKSAYGYVWRYADGK